MTAVEEEPPRPRLPGALSFSAMSLFDQCEQRYAWARIYRLPEPPSRAAVLGTFVHRVLEIVFSWPAGERWAPDAERHFEAARGVARQVFSEELDVDGSDFRLLGLDVEGVTAFRTDAWRLVRGYLVGADRVDVLSTEREVRTELDAVPVVGFVDRIERADDGMTVVVDYKTGSRPDPRWFSSSGDTHGRQVVFYGALLGRADGEMPSTGRLLYPDSEREVVIDARNAAQAAADARRTWDAIHRRFEAGEWKRSPTALCGWCPFVATCDDGARTVRRRWAAGKPVGDAAAEALGLSSEIAADRAGRTAR